MALPFSLAIPYRFDLKSALSLWECAYHTLIYTLPLEIQLPYLGVEPRMGDYPLSDGFPKISLYLFFQGLAKSA